MKCATCGNQMASNGTAVACGVCHYDRKIEPNDLASDGVSVIRWDKWEEAKLEQLRETADRLLSEGRSPEEVLVILPTLRKLDPRYVRKERHDR